MSRRRRGSKRQKRKEKATTTKKSSSGRTRAVVYPEGSIYDEDYGEWWANAYGLSVGMFGVGHEKIRPIADSIFGSSYFCVGDDKIERPEVEVQNKRVS